MRKAECVISRQSWKIISSQTAKEMAAAASSATRFGEIPPLWQILKIFGPIFMVYLVWGKVLNSLWHNLCALVQIFIAEIGQILKTQYGHLVTLAAASIGERARESRYCKKRRHKIKCTFLKRWHKMFFCNSR